ncbi:MAG: sugar phosphorylase [Chloroflexi bacterium]|nr:sugar phosphorylase [Chloroflexota bacterium]MDL1917303.1 sugar phosphorylase [Anaerolineae bacterium CFX4]MEB2366422.1 alpha-amylase family glycosyl hydrolase [Chloroflexota bacterium]
MSAASTAVRSLLASLYGADRAGALTARIQQLIRDSGISKRPAYDLSQRDVVAIAYGDHVRKEGEPPLVTLRELLKATYGEQINTVHVLPFYPYTSDDGFSVVDYWAVDPKLGTWDDVRALRAQFRMMFDAVFNHVSVSSAWFQAFLRGEAPYTDYFITVDPSTDLSLVRRPRTHPLLTPFETARGIQHVWTTFSADQVDVNAANPDLMLDLLRALLFYVAQGADLIRLDAIAYLWKEIGTTCIHLPQTHQVVQLMRAVLDMAAPDVLIVTETNVPHDENISYFGDGTNEAQMVYNFSLPPLLLHTFRTGDTTRLTAWAGTLERVGGRTTYFNFTASHDGIGVTPARGLLTDAEIDALVALATDHGGRVNYKTDSDGSRSPYELNITYFDAITHPDVTASDPQTAVKRFLCAQAIMLAFVGVPGIYFHSLFGSRNWAEGVEQTGHNRTINRQKLDYDTLLEDIVRPTLIPSMVYFGYRALLDARIAEPAFHPFGGQRVLAVHSSVFALERTSPDGMHRVIALFNVSGESVAVALADSGGGWHDLLGGDAPVHDGASIRLTLAPYQSAWLKAR